MLLKSTFLAFKKSCTNCPGWGGGNLDKIQKSTSFFLGTPSLSNWLDNTIFHIDWLEEEEEVGMRKASAVGNLACLWKMIIAKERWPVRSVHPARGRRCSVAPMLRSSPHLFLMRSGPAFRCHHHRPERPEKAGTTQNNWNGQFNFPPPTLRSAFGDFFVLLTLDFDYLCSETDFTQKEIFIQLQVSSILPFLLLFLRILYRSGPMRLTPLTVSLTVKYPFFGRLEECRSYVELHNIFVQ